MHLLSAKIADRENWGERLPHDPNIFVNDCAQAGEQVRAPPDNQRRYLGP